MQRLSMLIWTVQLINQAIRISESKLNRKLSSLWFFDVERCVLESFWFDVSHQGNGERFFPISFLAPEFSSRWARKTVFFLVFMEIIVCCVCYWMMRVAISARDRIKIKTVVKFVVFFRWKFISKHVSTPPWFHQWIVIWMFLLFIIQMSLLQ